MNSARLRHIITFDNMQTSLEKILEFTSQIEMLKKMERYRGQFYWRDYPEQERYESVADHSWRLGMMLILIKDELSQPLNVEKALKMALIHDAPEITAGDESPLGEDGTGKDTYAFNEQKQKKSI